MQKCQRRRLKPRRQLPEINLTSLVDVALTLLIIFMVTTPLLKKENSLEVELPKGNVQEVSDTMQQELIVSVDKAGKIALNGSVVARKDLIKTLQKKVSDKSKKTIFVKADTAVHYGNVIELVDEIKHVGGIRYVALATEKAA